MDDGQMGALLFAIVFAVLMTFVFRGRSRDDKARGGGGESNPPVRMGRCPKCGANTIFDHDGECGHCGKRSRKRQ